MPDLVAMDPAPAQQRICARCKWSRDDTGQLFQNADRAFCSHSSVNTDAGQPVPCESQRFATGSGLLQQCGVDGILFEARA